MRMLTLLLFLFIQIPAFTQGPGEGAIRKMLEAQVRAWNMGDKEAFMQGYWKSDSLMFIGKSGVTKGWQQTLDNYHRNYPDAAAMGKLTFDLLSFQKLSPSNYFVVGKWHLQRTAGDVSGHFSLVFKKIKGAWKIVADHSS